MTEKQKLAVKIGATIAVVLGALGFLLYSGIASGEVDKTVDAVLSEMPAWQGRRLQIRGNVVKDSIEKRIVGDKTEYKFKIAHNDKVIDIHYMGIVPDTFKDGAEVVCKGKLNPAGGFEVAPDGVMAKCPSKYKKEPGSN
jgi:cytochrome c-type biogenesis protein CcmE